MLGISPRSTQISSLKYGKFLRLYPFTLIIRDMYVAKYNTHTHTRAHTHVQSLSANLKSSKRQSAGLDGSNLI